VVPGWGCNRRPAAGRAPGLSIGGLSYDIPIVVKVRKKEQSTKMKSSPTNEIKPTTSKKEGRLTAGNLSVSQKFIYVVGSKIFRPDIKKPRQMENAVRDI
jgi:hypothetical protein